MEFINTKIDFFVTGTWPIIIFFLFHHNSINFSLLSQTQMPKNKTNELLKHNKNYLKFRISHVFSPCFTS